jgi:hypothetical protein
MHLFEQLPNSGGDRVCLACWGNDYAGWETSEKNVVEELPINATGGVPQVYLLAKSLVRSSYRLASNSIVEKKPNHGRSRMIKSKGNPGQN